MTTILLIETSTSVCSVGISQNGEIIALRESFDQNSHAGLVSVFVGELMNECGLRFDELDAIAVSKGPGSYTGLRIGVSSAKGICYGADKPLLALETLTAMASGFATQYASELRTNDLLCPMIDARRLEVYTSLFTPEQEKIRETEAVILDANSYSDYLKSHRIWFFGDGAPKCNEILTNPNVLIINDFYPSARYMASLAQSRFVAKQFENTAYFEPFYLKDFVAALPKVKGLQ